MRFSGTFRAVSATRYVTAWAVVCLAGHLVATQGSTGESYRALLNAYKTGTPLTREQLDALAKDDFLKQVDAAVETAGARDWPTLRTAAILHTEQWYRTIVVRRSDVADRQLEAAVRLLERVRQLEPGQLAFLERWQDCVADLMRTTGRSDDSEFFLSRTAIRFSVSAARRRARRELAAGMAEELDGAERPPALTANIELWPAWRAAARLYQEALQRDPSLAIASLHLGRVRMLQGESDVALQHFASLATADDSRVRYLASLFTGGLAERRGDWTLAEEHYKRAMDMYPPGQAAWLALSQLYSSIGREADARTVMAALAGRQGAIVEPLWTYLPVNRTALDVLLRLDEMRAEVQQ